MYQSRIFVAASGILSLVVILYGAFIHGSMFVVGLVNHDPFEQLDIIEAFMATPTVIALHLLSSLFGGALALALIFHAVRNPRLSRWSKVLWVPALAVGYGLIFYWYLHIRTQQESVDRQGDVPEAT